MPTDFAPYANLRLLIPQPAATPESLRSGVPASSASWVIECFAKAETGAGRDAPGPQSLDPSKRTLSGYITGWAVLPAETDWLAAGSAFAWDTTGLAPAGLAAGLRGKGLLGVLGDLPALTANPQRGEATILGLSGAFGPGGIGGELRAETGDAITIELQVST